MTTVLNMLFKYGYDVKIETLKTCVLEKHMDLIRFLNIQRASGQSLQLCTDLVLSHAGIYRQQSPEVLCEDTKFHEFMVAASHLNLESILADFIPCLVYAEESCLNRGVPHLMRGQHRQIIKDLAKEKFHLDPLPNGGPTCHWVVSRFFYWPVPNQPEICSRCRMDANVFNHCPYWNRKVCFFCGKMDYCTCGKEYVLEAFARLNNVG